MNWSSLREEFGDEIVDAIRTRLLSGSSPQVDKAPFVASGYPVGKVDALFDQLVSERLLERQSFLRCPDCGRTLPDDVDVEGICPHCEFDFGENGKPPIGDTIFITSNPPSREIPWLVALHGFNTHGEWQEEFAWLLATSFRHRAPAFMYKFPFLFFGVLLRRRHEALASDLDRRLRAAIVRAKEAGITEPPDVIAHSFGSLLFAKLLDRPGSRDLRFGRIIVAGAIVRPDYDWSAHLRSGRIEGILNHCSQRDTVVDYAQWAIPDSGPSGRLGFDDPEAINYLEGAFEHGTHFKAETMVESLRKDGLWYMFLRLPELSLKEAIPQHRPARPWKPMPTNIVATSRAAAIVFSAVIVTPIMVLIAGISFVWKGTT